MALAKAYIEDLVFAETRKLLTKENIDRIAKEVVLLCERETDTGNLKRLQKLLKENERATEKSPESPGKQTNHWCDRGTYLAKETGTQWTRAPDSCRNHCSSYPHSRWSALFPESIPKRYVNDHKYRQALVDTFINKIYLYDDKMTVLYNTQDSHSDVTIDELSSSRVALVEPQYREANIVVTPVGILLQARK